MDHATRAHLEGSAWAMRIVGWVLVPGLILGFLGYSPGFVWGTLPESLYIGPAHPPSPYDGLHPYVYMLVALYAAWAILLVRGAGDPAGNAALFDWGILANLLHCLVMVPQAFIFSNEHAHLWADIPITIILAAVMWYWHPDRGLSQPSTP